MIYQMLCHCSNFASFLIGKTITSGGKKLIADVLRANVAHLNVQIKGCRLLAALATTGKDEIIFAK